MQNKNRPPLKWILALQLMMTCLAFGNPGIPALESDLSLSPEMSGRVLINELGCSNCHDFPQNPLVSSRQGPTLEKSVNLIRPEFLAAFIQNPEQHLKGSKMPGMLGQMPIHEQQKTAEALAHYLIHSKIKSYPEELDTSQASTERGQQLYESIGCVACHGPLQNDKSSPLLPDSLQHVSGKYTMSNLVAFLKDPLEYRPSARMPDLHLTTAQALDLASFLNNSTQSPSKTVQRVFQPNPQLAELGKVKFSELGCVACHQVPGSPTRALMPATPVNDLNAGCLSTQSGQWPNYNLSESQRRQIQAALKSPTELSDTDRIHQAMTQLNCVACHERQDFGGVTEALDIYFTSTDPNLGEQGRLPPRLDGVGAKLNATWLRKILAEHSPARPYMKTRMPRFGAEVTESLIQTLLQSDSIESHPEITFEDENKAKGHGRDLAGTNGFSCVTCHTFQGQQTGAMGAVDLTLMGQRLNRDWFHAYMRSPQRFSPNTLMPAFWAAGEKSPLDILQNSTDQQIEALWLYLDEGYGMGAPRGVRREPMRLLAKENEAVMLRRKYPNVGKRGIGVGYPHQVNLVFNAEQMCLSLVWPGEFLDPAGVFMSQGHGNANPLSRPITIQNVPELAQLPNRDAEWPNIEGRPKTHQFLGYSLDEKRRPAFEYTFHDIHITDRFLDLQLNGKPTLRREITFSSVPEDQRIWFRVASGSEVELIAPNQIRFGSSLTIKTDSHHQAILWKSNDQTEWRVPIEPGLNSQTLILDYQF